MQVIVRSAGVGTPDVTFETNIDPIGAWERITGLRWTVIESDPEIPGRTPGRLRLASGLVNRPDVWMFTNV